MVTAHSPLWGNSNNHNGSGIEELMKAKNLISLNDGSGTKSVTDLILVSDSLPGVHSWETTKETAVGSGHCPVHSDIELSVAEWETGHVQKGCFGSAD